MARRLVIRADATSLTGAGHVMRGVVLALAWRRAIGPAMIWGTVDVPFVVRRIEEARLPVTPSPPDDGAEALVVDRYDEQVRAALASDPSFRVRVLVDDLGWPVPPGYDMVWNPNPHATPALYDGSGATAIAGPSVVPLRDDLPRWAGGGEPGVTRVGVLMGGAAIQGPLSELLRGMAASRPDCRFLGAGSWVPGDWERLDPDDVWSGLAACDVLVTAAGTTLLEAAAVGIPVVALQIADNQRQNLAWAHACGVPTLDATTAPGTVDAGRRLAACLDVARPLPPLEDGSAVVARAIANAVPTSVGHRR